MTIPGKFKNFGKNAKILTKSYRGPERRENALADDQLVDAPLDTTVDMNLENTSRRRLDDKTLNRLRSLDVRTEDKDPSGD